MIITIGNTKGGVGKSTIACNLAVTASINKKKVLLIDADTQNSTMSFRASREANDITAMAITTPTLHKDLPNFKGFDLIIVDAGGRDNSVFRSAILACDYLVIPCIPSQIDFWASSDVMEIIKEASIYKDIKSYFLLNLCMPQGILLQKVKEAIAKHSQTPLLDAFLCNRVAYKNAFAEGKGVAEWTDKKAKEEFTTFYKEIMHVNKTKA